MRADDRGEGQRPGARHASALRGGAVVSFPVLVLKRWRLVWLAGLAFLLYGAWAAWANHAHGLGASMRAFAVQGFSSATTTLLIGGVIERLRVRLGDTLQVRIAASVLATAAAAVFHVCLHLAAGTPEIVRTVVPSVGVGFLFAVTYTVWTFDEARSSSGARPGTP